MNPLIHLKVAALAALFLISPGIFAQDIHYAQTGNSPLNLNPGLTGVFGGNHRFAANFRRQWGSIPVPYLQFSGSYDIRFVSDKEYFTPWAAGLIFSYDRAGDARLSLAQLGLSGSYSHRLFPGKKNFLTFGAMLSGNQRSFSKSGLQFDDQYTVKEGFLTNSPTAEGFDNTGKFFGDISAGMNLHLQGDSTRTTFDMGAGVFHFTEPKKNFKDQATDRLESRYGLYVLSTLMLTRNFDLLFSGTVQFQGAYQEAVLGAGGLFHLSNKKTKELGLQFGLYYRPGDAVIPALGFRYKAWQVNMSYDLNTSPLREATSRRGGPEISVGYILRHVPLLNHCKSCPIYM